MCYVPFTCRYSMFLAFLWAVLAAPVLQAEPFTVWEQNLTIWARDEATGVEWPIRRGENAHSPDVEGPVAVWISDWSHPADVMGRVLDSDFTNADWAVAVQPEIASDPQVGYLNLPNEWAYAAWQQSGGVWAVRIRDLAPRPAEVIPDYASDFDLTGRTLTWDGGSIELSFPTVPEPGTLAMLLVGLLCAVWHINSRPGPSRFPFLLFQRNVAMRVAAIVSLLFVATAVSARAEWYQVILDQTPCLFPSGDSSHWESRVCGSQKARIEVRMDFDWDNRTATYRYFRLEQPDGLSFTASEEYTVGPGQTETVGIYVEFDPFLIESFNPTTVTIVPTTDASYDIMGPAHPIDQVLSLTGRYRVTGPTETVEGPLSVTLPDTPSLQYTLLLTHNYPIVTLFRPVEDVRAAWGGGGTLFETEVDGLPVKVGLDSIAYGMERLSLIPEPGSWVMLLIALCCLSIYRMSRYHWPSSTQS